MRLRLDCIRLLSCRLPLFPDVLVWFVSPRLSLLPVAWRASRSARGFSFLLNLLISTISAVSIMMGSVSPTPTMGVKLGGGRPERLLCAVRSLPTLGAAPVSTGVREEVREVVVCALDGSLNARPVAGVLVEVVVVVLLVPTRARCGALERVLELALVRASISAIDMEIGSSS
jgi:hypothetical protein